MVCSIFFIFSTCRYKAKWIAKTSNLQILKCTSLQRTSFNRFPLANKNTEGFLLLLLNNFHFVCCFLNTDYYMYIVIVYAKKQPKKLVWNRPTIARFRSRGSISFLIHFSWINHHQNVNGIKFSGHVKLLLCGINGTDAESSTN